ncbi:MAG: hypothetical protein RIB61_07010 [Roseicyclus sp.]
MFISDDLWLRGQTAQRNIQDVVNYTGAFWGTAMLQTMQMGLTAPQAFWTAMGRAGNAPTTQPATIPVPDMAKPLPQAAPVAPAAPVASVVAIRVREPDTAPPPPDDLTSLLGVGAKLAASLNAEGIHRYQQIAALDEAAVAALDARIKGFRMLAGRYDLVAQARTFG